MRMTLIVPSKKIGHFQIALKASGGWHVHNPMAVVDGQMVYIAFPDGSNQGNVFWQVYNDLTKTIVEIDNRKWYTKFLNKIRKWWND